MELLEMLQLPKKPLDASLIPFTSSYQLSCQAVSSTRTQSKLCTATLILFSYFDKCSDFILVIAFVSHPISFKISHR